jgi:prepilin-type N-terminal cleavage/methylation domain-containing protein
MNLPFEMRRGFTLVEVLVVTIIVGITLGFAAPTLGRALAEQRMQRAAAVIATDLRQAPSLAARQKAPIRMVIDEANRSYTLVDRSSGTTIVTRRLAGSGAEFQVATLVATPAQIDFFPNGIASGNATIIVRAAGQRRVISLTRAGHVRVSQ